MADTPQTLALLALAQNYGGGIVRQINRQSTTLRLLPWVKGEGKNCAFTTEADGAIGENFSDGADAVNFGSDAQASATQSWGLYRSNFHVTGLALAAAASSRTPEGVLALWGRNMVNAGAKLASVINAALFSGAGTGTLLAGLSVAIDDNNTYFGIDRTVGGNSYFRSTVVDPGVATAPTLALLRDDMRQVYEASGMYPDIAVCTPSVFNKIVSLFDATRRYVQDVTTAAGTVKLDPGLAAVEIDGCMFIKDKDCTANAIYYLNTQHVRIEYLPPKQPEQDMASSMLVQVPGGTGVGFGGMPLGASIEPIAKLGDSSRIQLKTYLQLVVDRPNTCGVRLNVSTS